MNESNRGFFRFFITLALVLPLSGCPGPFNMKLFKERASEKPAPSDGVMDKSFFVNPDGKPKTFLCAWAPEMTRGWLGERWFEVLVNNTPHCNIEFEIKEDALIGKRIHPSFPNDRGRWEEFIRIPINKHFYFEREKDQHGRETNKWIENDSRSHWSARPKFKLDLQSVTLPGFTSTQMQTSSAYEVEWDNDKGFLGFSIDMRAGTSRFWSALQAKVRVNFLQFEHDPTFKKTPYHQENSRFMNILHVMGRKIEGIEPELYAAHWDLRKTNTIYLNGVPKEHQNTVLGAIEKWNETLRAIGAIGPNQKAFEGKVADLKHPFDLRYPSINWISDYRLSKLAPLGIGMAHADVRNGKILWGSVTLWGGELEGYVSRYTPVAPSSSESSKSGDNADADLLNPIKVLSSLVLAHPPAMLEGIEQFTPAARPGLVATLQGSVTDEIRSQILVNGPKSQALGDSLKEQLQNFTRANPALNKVVDEFVQQAQKESRSVTQYLRDTPPARQFGSSLLNKVLFDQPQSTEDAAPRGAMAKARKESDPAKRANLLRALGRSDSSTFVEEGLNVENLAGSWANSPARKTRSLPEMLDSVVMDLTLHELGHFLGLGHQFKENIVPQTGTVPSRYVKDLAAKATEEQGFTNYTSVMGYRSGRTEMLIPAAEFKPGPHDELVLRYLYKSEYAAYDESKDDFIYGSVPANGKIPTMSQVSGQSGKFRASYFPQCNDIEASLGADPFCNRWDRGSRAQDIVKSYFEAVNDGLMSSLYSLVGGGSDSYYREALMWGVSLDTMSRVRMFYDEMRRRLRSEPDLKPLWNELRQDKNALLEFAQACDPKNDTPVRSEVLKKIFEHEDILDLCRANLIALNEFRFYLNLPNSDYTKIDHKNRYVRSGYLEGDAETNWGHIFGSWYQLSNLPLKISALHTLTSAHPYLAWDGDLFPNPFYDYEENRFLYRTLYPRQYTQLISDGVQHNMRFEASGQSETTGLGRTILAAGFMLPSMKYYSNDAARLPEDYNHLLDQQTEFQYAMIAVIVKATKPDANSAVKADHYKKFTAQLFDFFTGKTTSTRDVYLLPNGRVLVWANGTFIYPMTDLKFFSDTEAFTIAYKISYGYKPGDALVEDSVKAGLLEKHDSILRLCVDGFAGNGLANYFADKTEGTTAAACGENTEFDGFLIPPGIAEDTGNEKLDLFYKSVDAEFAKYDRKTSCEKKIPAGFPVKSMTALCEKAVKGVGQIAASAALINGFWLGITADYLEK